MPGEPGLWVFLFGDMIIFVVMFATFLNERSKDEGVFSSSRESLDLTIALTNTMVLLVSSLLVVVGINIARSGTFSKSGASGKSGAFNVCSALFAGAGICAAIFISLKVVEYVHMIGAGHGPDVNPYYMWLFILTGVHLSHVVVGFLALGMLFTRARRCVPVSGGDRVFYEGAACYWHMVDLLWMVLFPLVYLVA
ncbi:MAG: cytochrome c oxidase subunit 3 [Gordonia sp. (in: high G+C Gram-positive bacteria)]